MARSALAVLLFAGSAFALPLALAAAAPKTVWDGVYTTAQATRGKAIYTTYCSSCHQDDLAGGVEFDMRTAPALVRESFMEGRDMNNVFTFVRRSMPADNAGVLTEQGYLDVLAYILQQNMFPAGSDELKPDPELLKNIVVVGTKPN